MKDIIIFSIAGAIATALIIGLVVVPNPKEITSYLALSFVLVFDAIPLSLIILSFKQFKDKPKTISMYFVFWLSIVLYCCFIAVGFLTDAYIHAASATASTIILVFDCIFSAFGLAAFIGLTYQFIAYLSIRHCLKYGAEATAEFVSAGKMIVFESGRIGRGHTRFRFSVNFAYLAEGRKKTAKSRRVFSWEEVETLQKMGTFNIKYNKRTAVINEILKKDSSE